MSNSGMNYEEIIGATGVTKAEKGAAEGVATLTKGKELTASQVPVAVVNGSHKWDTEGNIALGTTLPALTTGKENVTLGKSTGNALTTGSGNVTLGALAGISLTTGPENVVVGFNALRTSSEALGCIAIGTYAMAAAKGPLLHNIAIGTSALQHVEAPEPWKGNPPLGMFNIAMGEEAGQSITTGYENIIIGPVAGQALTTGSHNLVLGESALLENQTGEGNVVLGHDACFKYTGSGIVAVGQNVLQQLTTGTENTGVGYKVLGHVLTGGGNTALGYEALLTQEGATGGNTAIGAQAGRLLTTGNTNTIIGNQVLTTATTASHTVAVGYKALNKLTEGASNTVLGYEAGVKITTAGISVLIGNEAGAALTTGSGNVAIGSSALGAVSTNTENVAVGSSALHESTNVSNTAVGHRAGAKIQNGKNNTFLGAHAGDTDGTTATTNGVENVVLLGMNTQATTNRVIVLGSAPAAPSLILGGVGSAANLGEGVGVFSITNASAAPTASYASGGILWVQAGALKYRGSSGTVTTLAVA